MAKQIDSIRLKSLSNGALFEYMKATIARAKADTVVAAQMAAQLTALETKQAAYDEVLKLSQKSEQTDEIAAYDKVRDDNYYAYKQMVRVMLGVAEGDQLAAAKKLQQHITDYRLDPDSDLRGESGLMTNFAADLTTKYAAEVAALNLTAIVAKMSAANDKVSALLLERDNANAGRVAGATKAARAECEEEYRSFVERLNALSIVDSEHDYSTFIDGMNEQIEQYRKRVLSSGKSSGSNTPSTTE